jgi:hypothetical protein
MKHLLLIALIVIFVAFILFTSPKQPQPQQGGNATGAPFFGTLEGLFRPKGYRLVKPVPQGTGYGYGEDF